MRLELATFNVRDAVFGSKTSLKDGLLTLDRAELLQIALDDPHLERAAIEIVRPGESARIISYRDVIAPMMKAKGSGKVYPGVCGRPITQVGSGRTHRLGDVSVIACVDLAGRPVSERSWPVALQSGSDDPFIDMSGPGAVTRYASTINVCLVASVPAGLGPEDWNQVVRAAALRLADRLAETTVGLTPSSVEKFDLTPRPALPGIVFIPHLASNEWFVGPRSRAGTAVYGQTRLSAPWLLHGTEMLDGAVGGWMNSMELTDNAVVRGLCREHGKRLNFVGCIIQRTNWTTQEEKEMAAERAADLASTLGAKGAIVTTDVRGQRFVETYLTVRECERRGIGTVLLSEEEDNENGNAPPLLVSGPEVKTYVSTGTGQVDGPFPAVERVVGGLSEVDEHWYGAQPPVPGRYGANHLRDYYGFGRQGMVDY